MRTLVAALLALLAAPAVAQAPSPQAATIAEGLDFYCAGWLAQRGTAIPARSESGARAGWREQRSAAPAVGPILIKGGDWGQVSVVRVAQTAGNRCSLAIQLAADGWTTETAHAAVIAWTGRAWPGATRIKDRGEGPRGTRESVWRLRSDSLTLQEAPDRAAQPNVFITLQRAAEI